MQPWSGIFLSRDMWEGDELRPGSMNGWNYAEGNPINHIDPSGLCPPGAPCPPDPEREPVLVIFDWLLITLGVDVESCNEQALGDLLRFAADLQHNQELTRQILEAMATPTPIQTQQQTKKTATPTITVTPDPRGVVRVQLQERFTTYDGIPLSDPGNGVTVAQVVAALTVLRNNPRIPKRHQGGAQVAYDAAVAWTLSRPPYGVAAVTKKSFRFPSDPNWRFDIDVLAGHHLRR